MRIAPFSCATVNTRHSRDILLLSTHVKYPELVIILLNTSVAFPFGLLAAICVQFM